MGDGDEKEKTTKYTPKGLRWLRVKAKTRKMPSKVIEVEKNYNFLSY